MLFNGSTTFEAKAVFLHSHAGENVSLLNHNFTNKPNSGTPNTLLSEPAVYSPNTYDGASRYTFRPRSARSGSRFVEAIFKCSTPGVPEAPVACVNLSLNRRLMDCRGLSAALLVLFGFSALFYVICLMSHGAAYMIHPHVLEECLLNKLSYVLCLYPPVVH